MQIVPAPYRCQKLKELGFPQEGCEFYYHRDLLSDEYTLHHITVASFDKECMKVGCIAAPTVEEMVEWAKNKLANSDYVFKSVHCGFNAGRMEHFCQLYGRGQEGYFPADTLSDDVSDVVLLVLEKEKV